jgi:tetratricopeptide (TPR) repeat protein
MAEQILKRLIFSVVAVLAIAATVPAQQGPTHGKLEVPRDAEMEVTAKHNLDVARYYLTKRKAYQGALDRLQEILQTYPEFSKIDEVVYLAGEADLKLGKTDDASKMYQKLIKESPDSDLVKKARERIEELKTIKASAPPPVNTDTKVAAKKDTKDQKKDSTDPPTLRVRDKPQGDKPVDKPASDKPASDKPASDKPASDKPASDKPASDKPASDKPASDKPASDKPPADKPSGV